MQQEQVCPNCGARIMEGQQFCEACGANFGGDVTNSTAICPGCGTVVSPDQRYCGVCGAQLTDVGQPEPPPPPPPPPKPIQQEPAMPHPRPIEQERGPVAEKEIKAKTSAVSKAPAARYGMLNFAVIVFRIIGWIILIGGCLGSIAIIVFAVIGGGFQTIIPGMDTLSGDLAVGFGIGCLIFSFIYGLAFIAFAELCRVVIGIASGISGKK